MTIVKANGIASSSRLAGFLAMTTFILISTTGAAATKIDPALDMATGVPSKTLSAVLSKSLHIKSVGKERMVDCLVRVRDVAAVRAFIGANGGTVRTVAGDVMTAWVPMDIIADLDAMPGVIYVEAAKLLRAKQGDSNATFSNGDGTATNPGNARVVTQTNVVQDGTGSGLGGTSYTGSGVIVGVVDTGIDCTHADFSTSGTSRMISYWDQSFTGTCNGGTGVSGVPQEVEGTGGCEYTASAIQAGTCSASPDSDTDEGHGTHVSGIAAGSNSTYTGMAPGAGIIAVLQTSSDANSGGTFSSSVLDAVNYIFRKAQSVKKPAVVNLSLGTSLGAHDDTSNFERGLNALVTSVQGRAIVNAQGNENLPTSDPSFATLGGIHALVSATSGSPVAYEFQVRSSSSIICPNSATPLSQCTGVMYVDVWLAAGGTCTVGVNAFSGSQKTSAGSASVSGVAVGDSSSANDGTIAISVNFTDSQNANNGKQHALVAITRASSSVASSVLGNYTYDLVFTGTCSGHAWLWPDFTSITDFSKNLNGTTNATYSYTYGAGDSNYTTTIPATASGVIATGSFMGRTNWTNINGTTVNNTGATGCVTGKGGTVGGISLFSSLGPTADGRVKPDITAPGEPIISTLASTATGVATVCKGDSTHHTLWGTSMAAPAVAGTVALMLQRNGCLTPAQIKSLLTGNATTDSSTGAIAASGSNTWGFGKVNALAAVVATTAATCSPDNTSEDGAGTTAATTTTTTDVGTAGCSLIRR